MRYQLVIDTHQEIIRDTETNRNLFFLASSGFGTNSETLRMARKVVDFLNNSHATGTQSEEKVVFGTKLNTSPD